MNAQDFSILTQNLHGYFPMGESPRFLEDRRGNFEPAPSHIFYFSEEELIRGHTRRLDHLASELLTIRPDIVVLQEVAAGAPGVQKSSDHFYQKISGDTPWENSVHRLAKRLNKDERNYYSFTACRGNVGWYTFPNDFQEKRVVTADKKIVHDFGANPYPNSVLVEGMGILTSQRIIILDHFYRRIQFNRRGDQVYGQFLAFSLKDSNQWFLLSNLHLSHKLANFEQAVAVRRFMHAYVETHPYHQVFSGHMVTGDFNATTYRPTQGNNDPCMIPWEVKVDGEFDFSNMTELKKNMLVDQLRSYNESLLKPWATIEANEAKERSFEVVDRFAELLNVIPSKHQSLRDSSPRRIADSEHQNYILLPSTTKTQSSEILFKQNNQFDLNGVSNHPAFMSKERICSE